MHRQIIPAELLEQLFSDTFRERFWSKIIKLGPNDCWLWTASTACGYGQMCIRWCGSQYRFNSHKLAWMLAHNSTVPDDKFILHSCVGTRACCNPAHLRTGTQLENIHDMDSQGRRANRKGERSATVKLTDEKVIEIRKIYAKGGVSQAAVGKRFGIGHTRAWEIVTRRAWKHI